jgi:hypothetical protein
LTKIIEGFHLNSDLTNIPLDIPSFSMPGNSSLPDIGVNVTEAGKVGDMVNLPKIEASAEDLSILSQQASVYKEDIKNIAQGNLNDARAFPEAIESQASKIDGIEELQKQSGVIEEYKNKIEDIKDTKSAREKGPAMAKEVAVDHFAGKQEQLKAAMEKISSYKQKYSSVSSLKDLAKRPPNAMKGKPFIERVVPGLYLQYQQKNSYLIDINPYVGYKITGRLVSGFGWNRRYAYERKTRAWNKRSIIFGPRGYVDLKLGKGFIGHIEAESMNTFVPSNLIGNPDTGHREWVWSFMTGLKKEYRIYNNLKGTALIQYNLFNRYYKAPYVDRLNSRIGFEYVLKKKKTKKSKP